MKGKKISDRQKIEIAKANIKVALSKKCLPEEVSRNEVARVVKMPASTVKKVMNEQEFGQYVYQVKQDLAIRFGDLVDRQLDYIEADMDNGAFAKSSPTAKYTSLGIATDKFNVLTGGTDARLVFTQNIVDVSGEITRILEKANKEKTKEVEG